MCFEYPFNKMSKTNTSTFFLNSCFVMILTLLHQRISCAWLLLRLKSFVANGNLFSQQLLETHNMCLLATDGIFSLFFGDKVGFFVRRKNAVGDLMSWRWGLAWTHQVEWLVSSLPICCHQLRYKAFVSLKTTQGKSLTEPADTSHLPLPDSTRIKTSVIVTNVPPHSFKCHLSLTQNQLTTSEG